MPERQSLKNKPLPKPRRTREGRHWKTGRKPMTRLQLAKLLELTGRSWRDIARQLDLV